MTETPPENETGTETSDEVVPDTETEASASQETDFEDTEQDETPDDNVEDTIGPNTKAFLAGREAYDTMYIALSNVIENTTDKRFMELLAQEEDSFQKGLYYRTLTYSQEEQRRQDALDTTFPENLQTEYSSAEGGVVIKQASPKPKKAGDGPRKITAQDGGFREFAKISGTVRRIPLPNSGFSVDICAPTKAAIYEFIHALNLDMTEYGQTMGAHFYMYHDLYVKQTAWTFIQKTIVGATLHNWDKRNVLEEAVSLHDFSTLLLAIASLMYPNGYREFAHVCASCDHVENVNIDLRKLHKTDFTKMPSQCIHDLNMKNRGLMGSDDLRRYHENLNFQEEVRFGTYGFRLKVPSLQDYFTAGDAYNAEVQKAYGDNVREIDNIINYRFNRILTPWVRTAVAYGEDDTGKEDVYSYTDDISVINELMDAVQTEDDDNILRNAITSFINKTQLSHICYPVFECPSCGYMPQTNTGFFTVDPLRVFFTMSLSRLRT